MPQSLVRNFTHIVFSTKNRYPFIDEPISEELFKYLGGICKELECYPTIVGGYLDHVHILCRLSQKIALMKLLEILKSHSSAWIKTKGSPYEHFYWQRGYGAFSVNYKGVDKVKSYIQNQTQHHQNKSFKKEYRTFLTEYNVDYDEQYVWD